MTIAPAAMRTPALVLMAALLGAPLQGAAESNATARIEARSSDLLAVGVVHGEHLSVHVSGLLDNAPIRDASVNVDLRGSVHPTVAEADGSYSLDSKDLSIPGAASVQFQITRGAAVEDLKGTLQVGESDKTDDKGAARQGMWWVLNFGVCIGFLWLLSRRRKTATT